MLVREKELYHFGIPGMKWGHRKQARYEKKLKKRQAKEAKNFYKQNYGKMFDKEFDYAKEFDKTKSGKKLLTDYNKQIKKIEKSNDWTDADDKKFIKTERAYLHKQGEYIANKMIKEFGSQKVSIYLNRGQIKEGENLIEKFKIANEAHGY